MSDYYSRGNGSGPPNASSSSSSAYPTVRPLPTPQGWGGVTSPTQGTTWSGGNSSRQPYGAPGNEERRTSGGGGQGAYSSYNREPLAGKQSLTSPNLGSHHHQQQQRPPSPLPHAPYYQPSSQQSYGSAYPTYPSLSSPPPPSRSPITRSKSPLPPGARCMATTDHDSFVKVDLEGANSSEAVKERIMTKLQIPDDDFFRYSLALTPLAGGDGRVLDHSELWDVARKAEPGLAIYAKLVVRGGGSTAGGGAGDEESGLPAGMSAERMRQAGRERAKERERHEQREREGSATSASGGGGISSPTSVHSATAPVGHHPRRNKSPSISSVSSSQQREGTGEFGERQRSPSSGGEGSGLRSDRPSWTWSHGSRGEGHQRHGSAGAGGGLSPPISGGARDRAGSITPTAPESRHDGEWAHSPPLASASATQTYSTIRSPPLGSTSTMGQGSQQVVMGPSGPTRRLPPHPGQQQQHAQGDERRMHTVPGPSVQMPPASAQPWSRSIPPPSAPQPRSFASHPHPQPPPIITRPLPPTDPRSSLPQYQPYVSGQQQQQQPHMFHNIALQGASPYPSYTNNHAPPITSHLASPNPSAERTVLMSKSADNLRGHYAQAFEHELRPPPVPPQPPSYRGGGGTPNGHPGAMGSRPAPPPPLQSSYPPVFDPRVMTVPLTPGSAGGNGSAGSGGYYRSSSASSGPSSAQSGGGAPSYPYPQPPPPSSSSTTTSRGPYGPINGPQPGQVWTTTPTSSQQQRRPTEPTWLPPPQQRPLAPPQPPRPPLPVALAVDTTRQLNLHPGETLQSAGSSTRSPRPPAGSSNPSPAPAAALMHTAAAAADLAGEVGEKDRYGAMEMRRDPSAGGGVPRALRAGGGGRERERDSGSSFASSSAGSATREEQRSSSSSSTSSAQARKMMTPQPSAPPAVEDSDPYDGMRADDDDVGAARPKQQQQRPTSRFTSPPSSARSSASGPLTPAQDIVPPVVVQQAEERTVELDEFGDPVGDETATWFPVNQPAIKMPSAVEVVSGAGSSCSMGRSESEGSEREKEPGTGTARAHEWAQAVLDRMGGGEEGEEQTLTRTLQPVVATAAVEAKEEEAEDKVDDDDESKFADVDEFGDDPNDDSTYFPGFGPPRPSFSPTTSANPAPIVTCLPGSATVSPVTSPLVGVSLRDEPSSRSPTADRLKRPNLRLKIETPPTPPDSHTSSAAAATGTAAGGKTSANPSPPSSSGPASSGHLRRAAAAGEPGDLASYMSSRRAERAERIRATASSRQQDSLMALGHPVSHSPNGGMLRRNSFRAREEDDKDWAIRPAVETVLENLDVFFPEIDLDKPVFDLPTPAPSTPSPVREAGGPSPTGSTERSVSASSVQQLAPGFSPNAPPPIHPARRAISSSAGLPGATGLSHKKSIRVVAQDRKRAMQKAGRNVVTAVSGLGSNLLRRKSTKLFGARIEEVTSAQMGRISTTIRESPDDDPQNFSYKWIKGDLIGRGTFGHVYIGFSVNTGETIAVKQVELPKSQHDKDDARTKGMVQSLKAEIELLKDLDHPNIVLYLGMEQTPEHLSIFLEYVPGGSVGRIVRTHGKFEENVIKFFTYQILEGLQYLHSLNILHRDMKADNILTDQDGMCKISDFGTSKKSTDIYNNNENMSMQGSIFWMAPEVIHNKNQGYSAKADIWSLGCILIEMFAGRRPWSDDEAIQAMFKLGAERLAPPVPADVTLSEPAGDFLHDCLQIDADKRPKALELQSHRFLELEEGWSFTQTDLYRHMARDERRRQASSAHPSG